MESAVILLLLLPLSGGVFHMVAGRLVPRWLVESLAVAVIIGAGAAAVTALALGWEQGAGLSLFTWFSAPGLEVAASLLVDRLSLLMAVMVSLVSLVIHLHSVPFMRNDPSYVRYFCFLNLFVFFMLVIVLADDLVFLFLGWEGVGFCSYALIGFWFGEDKRTAAGRKAFILTRIGDVAFLVAIGLIVVNLGSPSISNLATAAPAIGHGLALWLGLLMLWAAVGKSAQLPLLVWLPDAMAGPTPVSALIHAATMVTAGVYLLMRLFPLLAATPAVLFTVAAVGATTALFAALAALGQRDIKRVLAWSTISQVGFMFLGIGAGDVAGSMFHLLVHAFFKSLLFMAAGCVILFMDEEHDIFRMGSKVRKGLPQVFWLFLCGALALAAMPPTSGYVSKGRVLLAALANGREGFGLLWFMATLASFLTALYTFRLLFLVFFGQPARGAPKAKGVERRVSDAPHRARPSGPGSVGSMAIRGLRGLVSVLSSLFLFRFIFQALFGESAWAPSKEKVTPEMQHVLWPLALLALVGGVLNLPGDMGPSNWLARFLEPLPGVSVHLHGASELTVSIIDAVLSLAGLAGAWIVWGPGDRPGRRHPVAPGQGMRGALLAGFGLDWLYTASVAVPYRSVARALWRGMDIRVVDGAVRGAGRIGALVSLGTRQANTGRLSTFLLFFLVGVALLLGFMTGMLW